MRTNRGFTLIECLVASLIGTLIAVMLTLAITKVLTTRANLATREQYWQRVLMWLNTFDNDMRVHAHQDLKSDGQTLDFTFWQAHQRHALSVNVQGTHGLFSQMHWRFVGSDHQFYSHWPIHSTRKPIKLRAIEMRLTNQSGKTLVRWYPW